MRAVSPRTSSRTPSPAEVLYRRQVAAARNGNLEGWLERPVEEVARNLVAPRGTPEDVWTGLSAGSKCRSVLSRWDKRLASGSLREALTDRDLLRMSFPKADELGLAVIQVFFERTFFAQRNPTLESLGRYLIKQTESGDPIRLVVSQCFSKQSEVRERKLNYFLGEEQPPGDLGSFVRGVETLGWDSIQQLIERTPWPMEVMVLLGDMDWYSMDGCRGWASGRELEQLERELGAAQRDLELQASRRFPSGAVSVRRWTEFYTYEDFESELLRARQCDRWEEKSVMAESVLMYLDQWGYRTLARRRGISDDAMLSFIEGDCIRTAAQYRVEANCVAKLKAIQGWAERVPNPLWPLRVSNYDGQGVPPTIFLLGEGGSK